MCLRISRTPILALIVGVYLELSIRNGICDDSQINANSQYGTKENQPSVHPHAHRWKGWEDWVSSSGRGNQHNHQHSIHPQVPLSFSEQAKLRTKRNRNDRNNGKVEPSQTSKSSINSTEKTGHKLPQEGGVTLADLKSLKNAAISLASTVSNTFSHWSSSQNNEIHPEIPRNGRAVYLDNLDSPDGPNVGRPEKEAKRGVIDWLSRLIGTQGKTLGEFLREYQVHVLYDLAFTFFKWIFFLYAGLLIP